MAFRRAAGRPGAGELIFRWDAVKEFQVVATGATAEFGRTAAAHHNVIPKSGTNSFHGSLFYFQRWRVDWNTSDGKTAQGFFARALGGPPAVPSRRTRLSFSLGVEGTRRMSLRET